jgi:cytochrome c oxidase cbb3-type subunit IV
MVAGIITALLLLLFVTGWIWAWLPSRRADFDAAARLPLTDDLNEDTQR